MTHKNHSKFMMTLYGCSLHNSLQMFTLIIIKRIKHDLEGNVVYTIYTKMCVQFICILYTALQANVILLT